jgi:hypothetical protein
MLESKQSIFQVEDISLQDFSLILTYIYTNIFSSMLKSKNRTYIKSGKIFGDIKVCLCTFK